MTGQGGFSESTGAQQTQWACGELLPVARGPVCPGLPRRGAAASNFTDPAIAMKSASEVLVYSWLVKLRDMITISILFKYFLLPC